MSLCTGSKVNAYYEWYVWCFFSHEGILLYVEFVSTWGIKPEWIDFSDLLHVELLKKHIE